MVKGKLIFKSKTQAGKVCTLLNKLKDAEYNKRYYHFYTINKQLKYDINNEYEQQKLEDMIQKNSVLFVPDYCKNKLFNKIITKYRIWRFEKKLNKLW